MRDLRIYLHANTSWLQTLGHILAAACFLLKGSAMSLHTTAFLFWHFFYLGLAVFLALAALFQIVNKFSFRQLAGILNILAGVILIVESLANLTGPIVMLFLLNLAGGLLLVVTGLLEDWIRQIPYMAFNKQMIYGRTSLISSFTFHWTEIATVDFTGNQVKLINLQGQECCFRAARKSTGGIMYKAAAYFCQQHLRQQQKQKLDITAATLVPDSKSNRQTAISDFPAR